MKKILIFGCKGQLGTVLTSRLSLSADVKALSRSDFGGDITQTEQVSTVMNSFNPNLIINAAAYTAVDRAEFELESAYEVNARAVEFLAQACLNKKIKLIHYSTDYVFDGKGNVPYTEENSVHPINVYGQSKLLGENAIRSILNEHLILRTSWLYGNNGKNFFSSLLNVAKQTTCLRVVNDQIGTPTSVDFLTDITDVLIRLIFSPHYQNIYGTVHVVPDGYVSRYDLATWFFKQASQYRSSYAGIQVQPTKTSDFPSSAIRPLNSRLCNSKLKKILLDLYTIRTWDSYAREVIPLLVNKVSL